MDKRFSLIFLIASGAFFIFTVGFTGFRIEDARRHNAAAARAQSSELAAKVQSLRDTTGGYDAPQFRSDMREVFTSEPRLLLLSLHSEQNGIIYFISRSKSYLKNPPSISPDWRGTPVYQVNRGYDALVSTGLESGGTGTTMDALFVIMGREDFYPIVRDDLYLFLAFLLVCGVAILIIMSVQQDTMAPGAPFGEPRTGGPSFTAAAPAASPRAAFVSPAPGSSTAAHVERPQAQDEFPSDAQEAQQQSARALTSPRTGLVWAEHLEPRLKAELERASSSDQDISLARLRIDEPFADAKLPLVYAAIARMLLESLPLHDLIFETGNDSYTLLIPDCDVDAAVRVLESFRKKAAAATVEGKNRSVSIGVSSRGGRLIDASVLVTEADTAVAKASREGGNQVIGFRADPVRFRSALSGTRT